MKTSLSARHTSTPLGWLLRLRSAITRGALHLHLLLLTTHLPTAHQGMAHLLLTHLGPGHVLLTHHLLTHWPGMHVGGVVRVQQNGRGGIGVGFYAGWGHVEWPRDMLLLLHAVLGVVA